MSALMLIAMVGVGVSRGNTAQAVRTHTVVIESMKFTPATLRIKARDRVIFRNDDFVPHTATAEGPRGFDSQLIKAGESWSVQISAGPQTIRYRCIYHPTMKGEIVVEEG